VKTGVWCAVSQFRVIGSVFFEDTLNAEHYPDIITQFIALLEVDERDLSFQQGGHYLPHYKNKHGITLKLFREW
jgi:hypothetical protein